METRLCERCRGRGVIKYDSVTKRKCESCGGTGIRDDIRPSDLLVEYWNPNTNSYTMPGVFSTMHVLPEEFEEMVREAGYIKVKDLRSIFYNEDGHLYPDKLEAVEAAIKKFPDFDASQWVGGVSAIHVVLAFLEGEAHV